MILLVNIHTFSLCFIFLESIGSLAKPSATETTEKSTEAIPAANGDEQKWINSRTFFLYLHWELWENSPTLILMTLYCPVLKDWYLIGRNFVGGKFRRQKIFVGKNFRHVLKISSLFADEYFLPTIFYP